MDLVSILVYSREKWYLKRTRYWKKKRQNAIPAIFKIRCFSLLQFYITNVRLNHLQNSWIYLQIIEDIEKSTAFEMWEYSSNTHGPLGNLVVLVKIWNFPTLPSREIPAALRMNWEKLRNHWPSTYAHMYTCPKNIAYSGFQRKATMKQH